MDQPIKHANVIDDYRGLTTDRIRSLYCEKANQAIVGVESLKGTLNLGVIMRTCNAFAISRVIYYGRKRYDKRSTVGVEQYMPVEYRDLDHIRMLRDQYLIVGIDNNIPECVPYMDFTYPKKTLFLFGSEETGLSKEAKELCDCFVFIPQCGSVRSLNVSVAASIIIADYARQQDV